MMMMKELAVEELKILEAHHPTRYQFLKLELKEFIHLLDQQEHQQSFKPKQQNQNQNQIHLSVLTQESSNRKTEKMKREDKKDEHQRRKKKCKRDE